MSHQLEDVVAVLVCAEPSQHLSAVVVTGIHRDFG